MKRNLIILIFITLLCSLFYTFKPQQIPTFLMTEEAKVLTKGYYGSVLLVELTFEHTDLMTLITHQLTEHSLFLVDPNFLERADHIIKALKENNRQIGLLVVAPNNLEQAIQSYTNVIGERPLWIMLQSNEYTDDFRQTAFSHQINMVAPSLTLQTPYPTEIKKGSFVSLHLNQDDELLLDPLLTWLNDQSFTSIEESLFGYQMSSKKSP